MTLIGGKVYLKLIVVGTQATLPASQQRRHSLVFEGFQRAEASNSGLGTIQKH
jgi:hypothetical protein